MRKAIIPLVATAAAQLLVIGSIAAAFAFQPNVYRLGQYETAEIARAVLNDLYMHISTGCVYQMPNDQRALVLARGMSDERPDKFAGNGKKSVRRGGS